MIHKNDLLADACVEPRFLARYWSKVSKTETCWIWTSNINMCGYGTIQLPRRHMSASAHRVAWTIENGRIPDGMLICHNCPGGDNPACVNPKHLWIGTDDDNAKDKVRKGRHRCGPPHPGEKNAAAKLTDDRVLSARGRYAAGESGRSLAREYGVTQSTMQLALTRKKWRHLP